MDKAPLPHRAYPPRSRCTRQAQLHTIHTQREPPLFCLGGLPPRSLCFPGLHKNNPQISRQTSKVQVVIAIPPPSLTSTGGSDRNAIATRERKWPLLIQPAQASRRLIEALCTSHHAHRFILHSTYQYHIHAPPLIAADRNADSNLACTQTLREEAIYLSQISPRNNLLETRRSRCSLGHTISVIRLKTQEGSIREPFNFRHISSCDLRSGLEAAISF